MEWNPEFKMMRLLVSLGSTKVVRYEKKCDEVVDRLERWGWIGRIVKPAKNGDHSASREFYRAVVATEEGRSEMKRLRARGSE